MHITQVNKGENMVKIYFKGYSEKVDKWGPWHENNSSVINTIRTEVTTKQ